MFKYLSIFCTLVCLFILSSCSDEVIDTRIGKGSTVEPSISCDTSIYGDECNNLENFIIVRKDELNANNIKQGRSIGGVQGNFIVGESSQYSECSNDGEVGCIATEEYSAVNINNHKSKIVSNESILGVEGSFVVPEVSTVVSDTSYGIEGNLVGTIPNCSESGSGCYVKSYSQGESGYQLKALDFDDMYSKRSNIKNGYELVYGIEGTQTLCSVGGNNCYIGNSFKAVETDRLIAANIKSGISLGSVSGTYNGDYLDCTSSVHTGCIAVAEYPSVASTLTSSLLASASINGTPGNIEVCETGDSSCYISSNQLKAAESSLLLASNIKKDVVVGGVTGAYPNSTYKLEGATETVDLVSSNFNDLMVSSTVFEWFDAAGNRYTGSGDSDLVATNIKKDVDIFGVTGSYEHSGPETKGVGSRATLALKKKDGTVVCFGYEGDGGNCSEVAGLENVVDIFSHAFAFAALKSDGTVVTWGSSSSGGDSSSVQAQLTNVVNIYSASKYSGDGDDGGAFAALKSDGSVVTWGSSYWGGNSSTVATQLSSGVVNIFSTVGQGYYGAAFAALKEDGSVVTWGNGSGGDSSSPVGGSLSSGVTNIFSTNEAFAALKSDGSVVTWGSEWGGGDFTYSYGDWGGGVSEAPVGSLSSGVVNIFSAFGDFHDNKGGAFAALKSDGSVVTWGDLSSGGNSSSVSSQLSSGVTNIFSTYTAFAALKEDGSIVTWGNSSYGGDSSSVSSSLSSGVTNVFSNGYAFAAVKSDGSVVTWGDSSNGGDSSSVSASLSSGVVNIFSNTDVYSFRKGAFAALKSDGSVVTWGNSVTGGDSSEIREYTGSSSLTGIVNIFSAKKFFIGVREDESYVVWGSYTPW